MANPLLQMMFSPAAAPAVPMPLQPPSGNVDIATCTLEELCRTLTSPRHLSLLGQTLSRTCDGIISHMTD